MYLRYILYIFTIQYIQKQETSTHGCNNVESSETSPEYLLIYSTWAQNAFHICELLRGNIIEIIWRTKGNQKRGRTTKTEHGQKWKSVHCELAGMSHVTYALAVEWDIYVTVNHAALQRSVHGYKHLLLHEILSSITASDTEGWYRSLCRSSLNLFYESTLFCLSSFSGQKVTNEMNEGRQSSHCGM